QAKGATMVDNDRFAETGEVYSLSRARHALEGETVLAYGDVLFRSFILESLMGSSADIVLAVDARPLSGAEKPRVRDLVAADHAYSGDYLDDAPAHLSRMDAALPPADAAGEW